MEIYEIKRVIKQNNKWLYSILKRIKIVLDSIRRIPVEFREYSKIKKT